MKKIILVVLVLISLAVPCFAATTVTQSGNVINITAIDADVDIRAVASVMANRGIVSIQFYGGAVNDILVIRNTTLNTGPIMFNRKIIDADQLTTYPSTEYYFNSTFAPVIDFSDCTLSAGHRVKIVLGIPLK